MTRKRCVHGLTLEKGLRCDKGFIQVLIRRAQQSICKNFGPHTPKSQTVASIFLSQKRKEYLEGKIGILPTIPQKKFKDVAMLWYSLWKEEKKPDGTTAHNEEACYKVMWTLKSVLFPVFGMDWYDEIKPVKVLKWRMTYTDKGLSGVTANRYQAILSSIYSHTEKWVKTERIRPAFRLPLENPCVTVELAPQNKRERVLSIYEAKKLKFSFIQLNDLDGWEICKMALKTVLSTKDLKNLKIGEEIDIDRAKSSVPVSIPIVHLVQLNWKNWRKRWEKARKLAGILDFEFRDFRKSGINMLKGRHDLKLVSEYSGHANIKTTEKAYTIKKMEDMQPLAADITAQVDAI